MFFVENLNNELKRGCENEVRVGDGKLKINFARPYTGAKKGSCFRFLRGPPYMMQYVLLSILTPFFIEIDQKMSWCRPKN